MKISIKTIFITFSTLIAVLVTSCSLNEDAGETQTEEVVTGFDGIFIQEDRVGRPAVNTVFLAPDRKQDFNTTLTADLGANFQAEIKTALMGVSPAFNSETDENALELNAEVFSSILANDVLTVSLEGTTTFFDGINVLTGRTLQDDVIDTELLLIFGGADGSENPGLTSDNVDVNDKAFSNSFPYLPTAW